MSKGMEIIILESREGKGLGERHDTLCTTSPRLNIRPTPPVHSSIRCTLNGSYGNTALKEGFWEGSGKGSGEGFWEGGPVMGLTVQRGSEKGSQKGVSRRRLERPLWEYDPLGVRPIPSKGLTPKP